MDKDAAAERAIKAIVDGAPPLTYDALLTVQRIMFPEYVVAKTRTEYEAWYEKEMKERRARWLKKHPRT